MAAIFISHSSADNAVAADMKAWLEGLGHHSLFLDFDPEIGIKGGTGWEQTLYLKLRQSQAVIALLTPNWLASKWCFAELIQARERGKAIFPVKMQPCDAGNLFSDIQHIDFTAGGTEAYARLRNGLVERGLDPTDVFDWDAKRPPYPGLLAFGEQDAAIFFGRGPDVLRVLETLEALRRQGSEAPRLVLLLGASGSGKSSLVRAGVIPRLKKKRGEWLPVPPFRPQVEPLDELALVLAAAFKAHGGSREWSRLRDDLRQAALQTPVDGTVLLGLIQDLAIAARQPEATVLLTIDQAEELFSYTAADAAARFLRLIRATLEIGGARLMAIATLRSDSLDRFQDHPALQDEGYPQHFRYRALPLDPMPLRSFPEIIQGPARLAGLQLDDGLVEAMVGDTGTRDALPLLAFTLRRLYERGGADGRLTLRDYEVVGRLDGAVREEAERIIAEAKPNQDELEALHAAFVPALVRINAEGAYARRRALIGDLPRQILALLRRFIDARLLVTHRDPQGRETTEVAHEALIRTWPQLSSWLLEDRDRLRQLESLLRAAEEWDLNGRRDDLLVHRDGRLNDAEAMVASPRFSLSEASIERTYLAACRTAQQTRDAAAREEQDRRLRDAERIADEQKKAAEAQKGIAEKQKTIARGALVGSLALLLMAVLAVWQWRDAVEASRKVGEVQTIARQTSDIGMKPQQSLLLSVRAASLGQGSKGTLAAIDGVRKQLSTIGGRPLLGHKGATRTAAFSPDRRWLATGTEEGSIRLWDLNRVDPSIGGVALDGHVGPVHGLVFSADGRWLISGAEDGTVRLWRMTAAGAEPTRAFDERRYGAMRALAVSPDGQWLGVGTEKGNLCLWKMDADGPEEEPCDAWKDDAPVRHVQFSAKSRWFATTCSGACRNGRLSPVRLWDVSSEFPRRPPRLLYPVTKLTEPSLLAIAFSADEKRLAAAYGYVAEVWDLTQDAPPQHVLRTCPGSGGWINTLAWSPDDRWLAIGSADALLWDLTGSRKDPIALKGHIASVTSAVFSDDARWLATASDDATVRLWNVADLSTPSTLLRGQEAPIRHVVFSPGPSPHAIVAVGDEPAARIWSIPDPLVDPVVMRSDGNPVLIGMAVSADGTRIATSSAGESKLTLWSVDEPRRPERELPIPGPSHAIAFSPDGRWLAAKSQDQGVISLWSLLDLSKPPISLSENAWGDAKSLRFSPDGHRLASGTWNGDVNLWDVSGPSPVQEHSCHQGEPVREPAFSADGRYLATGAQGLSARLWDLSSPDPCANPRVLPHGNVVYEAVFSPDARWVATADFDGRGRLWDLKNGAEPKVVAAPAFKDRVLQAAFSPDGRWVAFGSWDWTLKLLDLTSASPGKAIELQGHRSRISAVSFSPDSRWLVSTSEDRTVRLWDPLDPSAAPIILRGHEDRVQDVLFSPDSRWAFTRAYDGTVRRWRLKLDDLVEAACRTAGRTLTADESSLLFGVEQTQSACEHMQQANGGLKGDADQRH